MIVCDSYFQNSTALINKLYTLNLLFFCYLFCVDYMLVISMALCWLFNEQSIAKNQWFVIFVVFVWEALWFMCLRNKCFIGVFIYR